MAEMGNMFIRSGSYDKKEHKNKTSVEVISHYLLRFFVYFCIFILFTMNFVAVSIALQTNRSKSLPFKLLSATYAFFFGFMYIIFNYYFYKVIVKGEGGRIYLCGEDPFPIYSVKGI